MAIKAYRDYYREKYNIHQPELICGTSAHAAVDKACSLMNIKLIKVSLDKTTYRMNIKEIENSITSNTICIYTSAPSYPHGAIDDISTISNISKKYNIGLHVDCCLGGFILPFARMLGYKVSSFDFSVPGVTSMSLDLHKYGYSLKGSSVVLYRTKELRHAQYFCYPDWTGGLFTTTTMQGSRSGKRCCIYIYIYIYILTLYFH
jgi:sphinganine-1-phosphate aldolase